MRTMARMGPLLVVVAIGEGADAAAAERASLQTTIAKHAAPAVAGAEGSTADLLLREVRTSSSPPRISNKSGINRLIILETINTSILNS